jgi:serine/threonine protein kinase
VELGRGSFGVVYRASWQGTEVAVKGLRTGGALLARQELAALLAEAATLALLRHPNVVGFLGVCLDSPAEPMLVTEFVGGGSLEERISPQSGTQLLTLAERRRVASGVAAGLVHIHSKPLVHRDLKPGNVLLTPNLTAKVADVGLARALHGTQAQMSATGAAGTPVYMAPEQWEEEQLTAKVDVYAFGVMLNEMETGTQPWQGAGNMMAIGLKVCRGDRPPATDRRAVAVLVARCWAKEPERRPTMEEVVRELSRLA